MIKRLLFLSCNPDGERRAEPPGALITLRPTSCDGSNCYRAWDLCMQRWRGLAKESASHYKHDPIVQLVVLPTDAMGDDALEVAIVTASWLYAAWKNTAEGSAFIAKWCP